ncbi:MAG: hypothetical protein KatS3mg070_1658 [Meiothermus sp.]|nr:MAG: hypothetical protein KatS3mg070_1658 [Meiothermus sp.]
MFLWPRANNFKMQSWFLLNGQEKPTDDLLDPLYAHQPSHIENSNDLVPGLFTSEAFL